MTTTIIGKKSQALLLIGSLLLSLLFAAYPAQAASKVTVGGITVSYSGSGLQAYYDSQDGTLTIEASGTGNLNVTVGPLAPSVWGQYVDMYFACSSAVLNSLTIKGRTDCRPYICGTVGYAKTVSILNGTVGDTDAYGRDFGLGRVLSLLPVSISLKSSVAKAQLLGYNHLQSAQSRVPNISASATQASQVEKPAMTGSVGQKRTLVEQAQEQAR